MTQLGSCNSLISDHEARMFQVFQEDEDESQHLWICGEEMARWSDVITEHGKKAI